MFSALLHKEIQQDFLPAGILPINTEAFPKVSLFHWVTLGVWLSRCPAGSGETLSSLQDEARTRPCYRGFRRAPCSHVWTAGRPSGEQEWALPSLGVCGVAGEA